MKIKVAYIVPVYNVNRYLDECLSSLNEIKTPKEIIVVDDCGSENPMEIIKKYLQFPDFKYIKNAENLGLGFARNEGMKVISKEVTHIYFVDSDDKVCSKNIDYEFKKLKIGISKIHCSYFSLLKNGSIEEKNEWDFFKKKIDNKIAKIPVHVWGSFWEKNIAVSTKFVSRSFEDLPWIISVFKEKHDISVQAKPTYFYRRRLSSIVNTISQKKFAKNLDDSARLIEVISLSDFIDREKRVMEQTRWFYELYFSLSRRKRREINVPNVKIDLNIRKIKVEIFLQKISLFKHWYIKPINSLVDKKFYFE